MIYFLSNQIHIRMIKMKQSLPSMENNKPLSMIDEKGILTNSKEFISRE